MRLKAFPVFQYPTESSDRFDVGAPRAPPLRSPKCCKRLAVAEREAENPLAKKRTDQRYSPGLQSPLPGPETQSRCRYRALGLLQSELSYRKAPQNSLSIQVSAGGKHGSNHSVAAKCNEKPGDGEVMKQLVRKRGVLWALWNFPVCW